MIIFTPEMVSQLESAENSDKFCQLIPSGAFERSSPAFKGIVILTKKVYSFATVRQYSLEQKLVLLNKAMQLVLMIPELAVCKPEYLSGFNGWIEAMGRRTENDVSPTFSHAEIPIIQQFLKSEILTCYEMYEFILDRNEEFTIETEIYEPIPTAVQMSMEKGEVVDPTTIENLRDLVGERAPIEEKKDPKKK